MITCNECGKQLKNTQGLNGHYRFAHKLNSPRSSERVPIRHAELATLGQLEELRAETHELLEQVGEQLRAASLVPVESAEHRQVLDDHGSGLCDSGQCAPCRDYRKVQAPVVWKLAQEALTGEIVAACEWADVIPAWRPVAEAVVAHRAHKLGLVEGTEDPEPLDALQSLARGAPDPEPDALTTIMADPQKMALFARAVTDGVLTRLRIK